MYKNKRFGFMSLLCAAALAAAFIVQPASEIDAASEINTGLIENGDFESGSACWNIVGDDGAYNIGTWPKSGAQSLDFWKDFAYRSDASQQLFGLPAGNYRLSAYYANNSACDNTYLYVKANNTVYKADMTAASTSWDGLAEISFSLSAPSDITVGVSVNGAAGYWHAVDDIVLYSDKAIVPANNTVKNAGFENSLDAWSVDGSSVTVSSSAYSGGKALQLSSQSDFTSKVSQTVTGLDKGYYYLTAYAKSNANGESCFIYGSNSSGAGSMTSIPVNDEWTLVTVRGLSVNADGKLEIGASADLNGGSSVYIDDLVLAKEINQSSKYDFLMGGDISELTYLENCGAVFYDENGTQKDPLAVFSEMGWNFVRIRLYNNPGSGRGNNGYYCHEKYMNLEDNIRLAKRAQKYGMKIQFTFHYSDFWTNGETHNIPADWQSRISGLSDSAAASVLEGLMYDYTKSTLQTLAANGIYPEYISIGNEIQSGLLFPYGKYSNWANLGKFLAAASKAVRDTMPQSKIVIHLDDCGNYSKYYTFFDNCAKYGVAYDVIGPSYYPYWSNRTIEEIVQFCNTMVSRYDKDILIMETGYNFSKTLPSGYTGQLENNGPYESQYPSTPEGQKNFMNALFNGLKSVKNGRCIGDIYWDPIMVEQNGVGWAMNESTKKADRNVISNTTLFDFNHKALPALKAYLYNQTDFSTSASYDTSILRSMTGFMLGMTNEDPVDFNNDGIINIIDLVMLKEAAF